jgi:hypothetical protein
MTASDTPATEEGTAMRKQEIFLIALLMTAIGSQAHAGMSGTSARVQQITNSESQAAVQAPQAPQVQPAPQQRRAPARQEQAARPSGSNFDGIWSVTNSPGCGLARRSAVEVIRGRISGPGLSGKVDPSGSVRTVAHGGGLSVISTGHTSPTSGSGTYEVSNGCTGTWTARKV